MSDTPGQGQESAVTETEEATQVEGSDVPVENTGAENTNAATEGGEQPASGNEETTEEAPPKAEESKTEDVEAEKSQEAQEGDVQSTPAEKPSEEDVAEDQAASEEPKVEEPPSEANAESEKVTTEEQKVEEKPTGENAEEEKTTSEEPKVDGANEENPVKGQEEEGKEEEKSAEAAGDTQQQDGEQLEDEAQKPHTPQQEAVQDEAGDKGVLDAVEDKLQDDAPDVPPTPIPSARPQTEEPPAEEEREYPVAPPVPEMEKRSAVASATPRDILNMFREDEQTQPLALNWTFGFNHHIGCLNLSDSARNLVVYASSHVAVLYDFENNVQKLLLGHANAITCIDCSSDKRWLVTADKGKNSSVIIWDSYTGIPVQSIFNIPGGTAAVAMAPGAKYIVTISAAKTQTVSVWDWTTNSEKPICSIELPRTFGVQTRVSFCPNDDEQFATNSDTQVVFFSWASGKLEFHSPFLSDDVFNRVVGLYSQTIYKDDTRQALTGTSQGNIIVWDPERSKYKNGYENAQFIQKRALKLVRLQDRAITTLTQTNGYIVTGDVTGAIKFYDSGLNLINWYNKGVEMGPVTAISFKYDPDFNPEILAESNMYPNDATIPANPFIVRDFAVSTKHSEIFNMHADGSSVHRILCEHDAAVHAIAASSTKPWICIGSYAGLLKIWNYETKQCVVTRIFEKGNHIQCVTFDPLGLQIAVGMTNGTVHIVDSISLTDLIEKPFRYARDAVTYIAFSHDSKYLATADADHATSVFAYDADYGWKYLGRYRAHYKTIIDLSFGVALDSNLPRLLTLGEDRTLVEYDLPNSSKDDLRLLSVDRIEQSAVPSCLAWYPDVTKESFLVTANDQYKYKLYNTTTKMCRKTLLAPTYGSSIRRIVPLPGDKIDPDNKLRLMAYITKYKVGLQILPLDGNPHKSVALVGHPNGISHLSCSHDGKHLFTAGGKDSCVHMWSISHKALEAAASLGGEGLLPFYGLLEGGAEGDLFAELENYFYFAQLRSQGLETTELREVSTVIPLDQIPFVMRALGFYPSEQEVEDMLNEVKFSDYVETGQYVTEINLGDFIKLYVNHRPAFGLSPDEIQKAFTTLGITSSSGETSIGKPELYNILQRKGEHMTEQELSDCLATLLGINPEGGSTDFEKGYEDDSMSEFLDSILPNQITASMFSEEILGLPAVDPEE